MDSCNEKSIVDLNLTHTAALYDAHHDAAFGLQLGTRHDAVPPDARRGDDGVVGGVVDVVVAVCQ